MVCRKCTRKLKGGFGHKGREKLATELKHALRAGERRGKLRVIEVDCLSLCPKKAVTVIAPGRPGEMLVVPKGTDAVTVLRALDGSNTEIRTA